MSDVRNIIEYATSDRPPWYRRPLTIVQLLVLVLIFAGIVQLLVPTTIRRRQWDHEQSHCRSNMRQLAQMMQLYANDNRGAYPDSLDSLVHYADPLDHDLFCCSLKFVHSTPPPTTQAFIDILKDPASGSYLYLPPTGNPQPNEVLLVERQAAHPNPTPANVILGDGSGRFITAAQHQKILQQIGEGKTKIILPP